MLNKATPYHATAANLRENGYHVMPVWPGKKIPGTWSGSEWSGMPGWAKYCDAMPADFLHEKWESWPDAGICVAHGAIIGLDLDTDDKDVASALHGAVEVSPVKRRGQKGFMGYYRPGSGLEGHTARVRWYRGDAVAVELLLHGTQSVLPPTIHPETGKPYAWITPDTLESTDISELPEFSGDDFDAVDKALKAIGLTRKAPRRVSGNEYERPSATTHDLEKPFGRSLNDRAMEPSAMDQWWPSLDLPKSKQRGLGAWEAVPWWRASGSGRALHDRNPNLKASPGGIVDFGADRSYTPIDVVMAARDCSFDAATEWIGQFVRPEDGAQQDFDAIRLNTEARSEGETGKTNDSLEPIPVTTQSRYAPTPVFTGSRSFGKIKPIVLPSDAEWEAMMPKIPPAFPIQSFDHCEGLLGEVAAHLDNASVLHSEAGALAVALPLLGAAMGQAYETPSRLRTNIYSVALGGSGTGKTSLVKPSKDLLVLSQLTDLIGNDRIKSGSGLLQMLRQGARRVCFLDEFGHMLQQIGSAGSGIHSKEILTEFTALYSAANSIFSGSAYADGRENSINFPHLCIFGMATPEQFWRAFGSSAMEDGSIARYLIFPLGKTGTKEPDDSAAEATGEAIRSIAQVVARRPATGNLGASEVMRVQLDDYAEKSRLALKEKEESFAEYAEVNGVKGGPAIIRRVTENALKIALISAVGRSPAHPEIDNRDMEIGHALAWWSANTMVSSIASHIADNQYERDVNAVERFILDAGSRGRSMSEMMRRFRSIKARDMKEIIEALEKEEGVVSEITPNGAGGRPTKIIRGV